MHKLPFKNIIELKKVKQKIRKRKKKRNNKRKKKRKKKKLMIENKKRIRKSARNFLIQLKKWKSLL
jgi:hypothetical protein